MIKAIKITQEHLDLNELGSLVIGDIKIFNQLPNKWNRINGFKSATEQQLIELGFKDVVEPVITSEQYLGEYYLDNDVVTRYVVDKVQKTAQELYDSLVIEGNMVFDNYRKMLSEASSPYMILGTVPNELKVLTQTMLDAKQRITDDLNYYLSIDDVTNLKAFRFDTDEAEQLKQAIQNFK